jgi:CheY-like chemotaxis protein
MDIQMPGVNGVEALKTIRTVAPHLTVIMMTAFTSDELVEEARRASAVDVLFKPFDIARVLDLISSSARPGGAPGARA